MRNFTSLISVQKLAGVAAALMILPVAVACSVASDEAAVDTTSETPTSVEESASAPAEDSAATDETIVDIAMTDGSFNTLISALEAAGLKDQLGESGEYTVFAPTDEAFAKLPAGTLEMLLLPENKEVLIQVLSYHVVDSKLLSSDIETGNAATVGGEDVAIELAEASVKVNDATVIKPDVMASNGVIHAIDTVLLPPSLDLSTLSSPTE